MPKSSHVFFRPSLSCMARSLLLPLGLLNLAQAQPVPDAGSIRQQIEQGQRPTLPPPKQLEAPPQPAAARSDGETITVNSFVFRGNTLIGSGELTPLVSRYLNRPITFAEAQEAAAAVAAHYRKAGWVVNVYLPEQDFKSGIVTLQIVEARFGGARIDGDAPSRIDPDRVLDRVAAAQPRGEPLNTHKIERALLLLDDLPGITASGSLQAGDQVGETALALKLNDEPLVTGGVRVDNAGLRSTGHNQISAHAVVNSPLKMGDQLALHFLHASGNDYGRLAYTRPVGNDGWRVGVNGSLQAYDLITAEFRALDASGDSQTIGLEANYPIIRSGVGNLLFNVNADHKRYANEANGFTTTKYTVNTAAFSLYGNRFNDFGGTSSANLTWTYGHLGLGELNFGENASLDGSFNKLRYYINHQQVLNDVFSMYLAYSGQWANTNLDTSEKFYLGGSGGVRAYPASEAGGSAGQLLNAELRAQLPQGFVLSGFYDWGRIRQFVDAPPVSVGSNAYSLSGYGLSLGWQSKFGLMANVTWAHRIGDNPNPTDNGNDQDGSLNKNRWWLSVEQRF